jgi:transcription antitermination factor NusG
MPKDDERGQAASELRAGDRVRIMSGEYKGFVAMVQSVDSASGNVRVLFDILGWRGGTLVFERSSLSPIR